MTKTMLALIGAGAAMALLSGDAAAGAMPVTALGQQVQGDVAQVYHRGRPHRVYRSYPRQRVVVYPHRYAYPAYPDYYATSRGFMDPGFAVRGNMPGCAVDLGYGRWESCDK